MTVDLDTVCVSLRSPVEWAASASLPDTKAHFQAVVDHLNAPKVVALAKDMQWLEMMIVP